MIPSTASDPAHVITALGSPCRPSAFQDSCPHLANPVPPRWVRLQSRRALKGVWRELRDEYQLRASYLFADEGLIELDGQYHSRRTWSAQQASEELTAEQTRLEEILGPHGALWATARIDHYRGVGLITANKVRAGAARAPGGMPAASLDHLFIKPIVSEILAPLPSLHRAVVVKLAAGFPGSLNQLVGIAHVILT